MGDTPKGVIEKIKEKLAANPEVSGKIDAIFQFVIHGDDGGEWWFDLTKAPPETGEGNNENAVCTVTMASDDFVAMVNREAEPMKLFMSGKLKIGGDISAAMKLQNLF
ncbi:MAG: SCP2 sterol-binding domain-containing protein [Deltaproteobacteria bacterium]|nr:SCP2 sterol-binding domain-containing protein [Deltaproteobacteria bacterium]